MDNFQKILSYSFAGNNVSQWIVAFFVFLAVYITLPVLRKTITKNLAKLAKKTQTDIDDLIVKIIKNINGVLFFAIAMFVAFSVLNIKDSLHKWINLIFMLIILLEIIKLINKIIEYSAEKITNKNKENQGIIGFGSGFIKLIVWLIAGLFLMQNLGINVSSLIAGLGIGGIAIALALQSVLGDMFSSFSIFMDKPFKIGDYIVIGDLQGTVKKVGIKTTRMESVTGEEIVISNQDLTSTRLKNYKKMRKRRGDFMLGVEYSTPKKKLDRIPAIIKEIIEKTEDMDVVRVYFKEFGDFSLNFEVVFWVDSREYITFCEKKEGLNYAIHSAFEKEKISFAFPTQTVFVQKG